jgi:hypothetical protein
MDLAVEMRDILLKRGWCPAYVNPIVDRLGPMLQSIAEADGEDPVQVLFEFVSDLTHGVRDNHGHYLKLKMGRP